MIADQILTAAIPKIVQRSEREPDLQTLSKIFVDVGLLVQVDSPNNQIIYGRRGTGKTHVLKKIQSNILGQDKNAVIYIDTRMLGSSAQFLDSSVPLPSRCASLFKDLLLEVYNGLLDFVTAPGKPRGESMEALRNFYSAISFKEQESVDEQWAQRSVEKNEDGAALRGSLRKLDVSGELTEKESLEIENKLTGKIRSQDKVIFPDINRSLADVLRIEKVQLNLLIDEWSSLPQDVQPYLSELLKRSFLPNPSITVKIAALEYRSQFIITLSNGNTVGFEPGADVAAVLDVDDYFVYDKAPESVVKSFREILFNHINSGLPDGYLVKEYDVKSPFEFIKAMFSSQSVFIELVRASEGVARDLINIYSVAFFDSQRRGVSKVDKKSIIEAARLWYEKDKESHLEDSLKLVLDRIINEVIGKRSARSFMLRRELEKNLKIQKLFDMRVLHLMQRGYADKDNPGVRYNIYSLDYGTYVGLKNTSKEPQIDFVEFKEGQDLVVPFDDKRSIRRIVLQEEILK